MFVGDPMVENFAKLKTRIYDSIKETNLDKLFKNLESIKGPTLIAGVGGSSIVSAYLAKVLSAKNKVIALEVSPRDVLYRDLSAWENVVAVSYSGSKAGVKACLNCNLNKYLFSGKEIEGTISLQYKCADMEKSYISIAGTMIALSILFLYYTDNNMDLLKEILDSTFDYQAQENSVYEIMYGYEDKTAAIALESSMVESGIGVPILHDKYNFCHGRINTHRYTNSELIFFKHDNELDNLYDDVMKDLYHRVTKIDAKYDDEVVNDFYFTNLTYQMCREMAILKGIDLSKIVELPINDTFYTYDGEM